MYVPVSLVSVIHLFDAPWQSGGHEEVFKTLRQAEHPAVVEISLLGFQYDGSGTLRLPDAIKERWRVWKRGLIDVLKSSPSKERKFLRWRFTSSNRGIIGFAESGELEVFPGTSL